MALQTPQSASERITHVKEDTTTLISSLADLYLYLKNPVDVRKQKEKILLFFLGINFKQLPPTKFFHHFAQLRDCKDIRLIFKQANVTTSTELFDQGFNQLLKIDLARTRLSIALQKIRYDGLLADEIPASSFLQFVSNFLKLSNGPPKLFEFYLQKDVEVRISESIAEINCNLAINSSNQLNSILEGLLSLMQVIPKSIQHLQFRFGNSLKQTQQVKRIDIYNQLIESIGSFHNLVSLKVQLNLSSVHSSEANQAFRYINLTSLPQNQNLKFIQIQEIQKTDDIRSQFELTQGLADSHSFFSLNQVEGIFFTKHNDNLVVKKPLLIIQKQNGVFSISSKENPNNLGFISKSILSWKMTQLTSINLKLTFQFFDNNDTKNAFSKFLSQQNILEKLEIEIVETQLFPQISQTKLTLFACMVIQALSQTQTLKQLKMDFSSLKISLDNQKFASELISCSLKNLETFILRVSAFNQNNSISPLACVLRNYKKIQHLEIIQNSAYNESIELVKNIITAKLRCEESELLQFLKFFEDDEESEDSCFRKTETIIGQQDPELIVQILSDGLKNSENLANSLTKVSRSILRFQIKFNRLNDLKPLPIMEQFIFNPHKNIELYINDEVIISFSKFQITWKLQNKDFQIEKKIEAISNQIEQKIDNSIIQHNVEGSVLLLVQPETKNKDSILVDDLVIEIDSNSGDDVIEVLDESEAEKINVTNSTNNKKEEKEKKQIVNSAYQKLIDILNLLGKQKKEVQLVFEEPENVFFDSWVDQPPLLPKVFSFKLTQSYYAFNLTSVKQLRNFFQKAFTCQPKGRKTSEFHFNLDSRIPNNLSVILFSSFKSAQSLQKFSFINPQGEYGLQGIQQLFYSISFLKNLKYLELDIKLKVRGITQIQNELPKLVNRIGNDSLPLLESLSLSIAFSWREKIPLQKFIADFGQSLCNLSPNVSAINLNLKNWVFVRDENYLQYLRQLLSFLRRESLKEVSIAMSSQSDIPLISEISSSLIMSSVSKISLDLTYHDFSPLPIYQRFIHLEKAFEEFRFDNLTDGFSLITPEINFNITNGVLSFLQSASNVFLSGIETLPLYLRRKFIHNFMKLLTEIPPNVRIDFSQIEGQLNNFLNETNNL